MWQDAYMVLFGGKGTGNTALNDLYVLDCNSLTWHHVPFKGDPPSIRFNHGCALSGNHFFVYGGSSSGQEYKDDTVVFDWQVRAWHRPSYTGRPPPARARHSMTTIGERLFIFGGTNAEVKLGDLHALDLGHVRELERAQHQLGYLLGKNLDQLSFTELDELEVTMYRSLRSVSQAKKERQDREHRQEVAELKRRLADASASSPVAAMGELASATPDSSDAESSKGKSGKKLRFETVQVRTMNRAPGEGVPRSGTAPLGLGWNVMAEEVKSINAYESERRRKEARLGPLPEDRREKILLKAGATQADLDREKNTLAVLLKDRQESLEPPTPEQEKK